MKPLQNKVVCDDWECEEGHIFYVDEKGALPSECPFCTAIKNYMHGNLACGDCNIYGVGFEEGSENMKNKILKILQRKEDNETIAHEI